MKKQCFFLLLFTISCTSNFAQLIPKQRIQDSVIGWMKVYNFKGVKKELKVDNKIYSAKQLSICDSFVNWLQASYMPRGGLGDAKKAVSEKLGLYNQNDAALPQCYGAYAKTYTELKYNPNKKLEPATNSHLLWKIMANELYGSPANALCTPTQYYFTLPNFAEQGYGDELEKLYDLSTHPVIQQYPTYYKRNSKTGNQKMVLLFKKNQFPFIKITKGEYLQVTEAAVAKLYEDEKKKIYRDNQGNQKSIDYFLEYLNAKNEKRILCLKNNKEKYKNRLQEPAEIFTTEPDVLLENYPDVFEGSGGRHLKLPVYKVDPAIAALCKTDQPQWIVVSWTIAINEPVGKQLHEAVINNFNFDYLYNFFFDVKKTKGQPYQPLRSPAYMEAVKVKESTAATNTNSADKSIHFFEDYTTTTMGSKPIGWQTKLGPTGTTSVVTKLDGLDGNWATMNDGEAIPAQIKKPYKGNYPKER